ncbi:MAG TPA: PHB depolymerase family esterase [Tepidisphaeraceae bacterium]|jgi:predicted peptidase|nr:PHB depolymerase family esterase [Tepidisphaeraceae bacterium]
MLKSWKSIAALAAISIASVVCLTPSAVRAEPQTGQHAEKFEKGSAKLDYLLYLPADYNKQPDKKWPLILFLHGSGERGSDVMKVKVHGPPKIVEAEPDSALAKQFVVVSPQCPEKGWWNSDALSGLLDEIQAKYKIDPDRVYLTGLSMGGFGTWALASKTPERFAAIAPMCGGGNPADAEKLKNVPVWDFHGGADPTVPVQKSRDMVAALKKVGADVKYTEYPGVGHDCWTRSYANPELYTWFLSHKRGEKPAAAPAAK